MKKSVKDLKPGDALFDMHYAFNKPALTFDIKEPSRERSRIRIEAGGGSRFIEKAVESLLQDDYMYINKLLVVMDWPEHDRNDDSKIIVKAGWSYDGMSFGLMTIEVDA